MNKIIPLVYDSEKLLVMEDDGGWRKESSFIKKAGEQYLAYGKPELLVWAINNSLPGLLEDEGIKEILKYLVQGKPIRKRGEKLRGPTIDRQEEAIKRVWFYIGRGHPVYINPESEANLVESACYLAGNEVGLSESQTHKIWKRAGGHNPKGILKIVSQFYIEKGKE